MPHGGSEITLLTSSPHGLVFTGAPINGRFAECPGAYFRRSQITPISVLLVRIMSLFLSKKACGLDVLLQEIVTLGNM